MCVDGTDHDGKWPIEIKFHANRQGNRGGKQTWQGDGGGPHRCSIFPQKVIVDGKAVTPVYDVSQREIVADRIVAFACDILDHIVEAGQKIDSLDLEDYWLHQWMRPPSVVVVQIDTSLCKNIGGRSDRPAPQLSPFQ